MDMVNMYGKMVGNIQDIILMIKNKDMENIIGLMEKYTKENGLMAKGKEQGKLFNKMARLSQVYGKMIKKLDGLIKINIIKLLISIIIMIMIIK